MSGLVEHEKGRADVAGAASQRKFVCSDAHTEVSSQFHVFEAAHDIQSLLPLGLCCRLMSGLSRKGTTASLAPRTLAHGTTTCSQPHN